MRSTHQGSQSSRGGPHNATPSNSRQLEDGPATNSAPDSAHPSTSRRRYVLNAVAESPVETMRTLSEFRLSIERRGTSKCPSPFQSTNHLRVFRGEWRVLFEGLSLFIPSIDHSVSQRMSPGRTKSPVRKQKFNEEWEGHVSNDVGRGIGRGNSPDGSMSWRTYGRSISILTRRSRAVPGD